LGHGVGDCLLKEVSKRLALCVRDTDMVARLGGDEFTVILNNVSDTAHIDRVAQSILDSLSKPFSLENEVVYLSTSIGISLFPKDATDFDELLKYADQAMYRSKEMGRNCFTYFTASMQEQSQSRMSIAADLRTALVKEQFWVAYQPIVELITGNIFKAEALIRWHHPERGPIGPSEFIPIAENTGLINDIGNWLFLQVANQVKEWQQVYSSTFQISVNKSPVQFCNDDPRFKGWGEQLKELNLSKNSLCVEITEGLLLDASEITNRKLLEFRDVGMQVALDDFGTGYSSLSYIQKFDIDYIKIDQSFVRNLKRDSNEMALCEAIITMSHKLGIKTIAEGVETEEQRDLLIAAKCDYGQGYLFAKPVPAEEFEKLLSTTFV
jgi:predicted signal transduction protein with EAL and GGDEF domain